jgi:AcrR family transcriptional regulator
LARPRKDPEIRRSLFISAAENLFFSKGYKNTSVQDILQAVGDRTVSPSVFYYYFSSKESIYQAVMENYCDEYIRLLQKCFTDATVPVEERLLNAMKVMTEILRESIGKVDDLSTTENRLFALDLRDRTTRKIGEMMAETLYTYPLPGSTPVQKRHMSMYITGGIGEIINHIMFTSGTTEEEMKQIMKDIMQFSADVIGVSRTVLRRLTRR